MKEETIRAIKKHFCVENLDEKFVLFPSTIGSSIVLIEVLGITICYAPQNYYEIICKIKNCNLLKIKNYFSKKNKIKIDEVKYYFADSSDKLHSRWSKKAVIRPLTQKDHEAFIDFEKHISIDDLDQGQVTMDDLRVTGAFIGADLIGVSSLLNFDEIYDIGVIVNERYRNMGIGRSLVSKVISKTLKEGKIIRYYADGKNRASIKIAESLGLPKVAKKSTILVSHL